MPTLSAGLGMKRIVDIACGSHHSVALTEDGEVSEASKYDDDNLLLLLDSWLDLGVCLGTK